MANGTIKRVFLEKGYGFIQPDEAGDDVWFHASKVKGEMSFDQLSLGLAVEYETDVTPRGLQATGVRAIGMSAARRSPPNKAVYRFLNPYNFVRFLVPREKTLQPESEPLTAMGADFGAKGIRADKQKPLSSDARLLGRCPPPPHDRYVALTGRIRCELKAVTPLFISDPRFEPRGEHRIYEFFTVAGKAILPAASLRGALRSVFEAVTNSCVATLTDARLSYHMEASNASKLVPARVDLAVA